MPSQKIIAKAFNCSWLSKRNYNILFCISRFYTVVIYSDTEVNIGENVEVTNLKLIPRLADWEPDCKIHV